MSEIDAKSLSAEEKALWDQLALSATYGEADHDSPHMLVRYKAEWLIEGRRALFGSPASEGDKVECPNCLQKVPSELEHWHSGYHDDNCTVEPHYVCEQQISELDDRHNRMASPEYQAKVKADMNRRVVEIGVDRLVGITAFPVGNCPTCGELVAPWNKHAKYEGGYTCQPAQPSPVAKVRMTEELEAVPVEEIEKLREEGVDDYWAELFPHVVDAIDLWLATVTK